MDTSRSIHQPPPPTGPRTVPPPPAPPPVPQPAEGQPPPEPSRFVGAQWLAGVGAILMAAAGTSLLTSQWDALSAWARLATMVVGTVIAGAAAHQLRDRTPGTARALLLLAGTLLALDGGATVLVAGGGWPAASLVCGLVGLATAEALFRRIGGPALQLLTVGAGTITCVGAAALSGVPAAVLSGCLAVGAALVAGRTTSSSWRFGAAGWGALTALAPLAAVANEWTFTGQGTLRDMGLLGDHLGWTAVISATLAFLTFGLRAWRTTDQRYVVAMIGSVLAGGLGYWEFSEPEGTWLAVAAGAAFLLMEFAALALERSPVWAGFADRWMTRVELLGGSVLTLFLFTAGLEIRSIPLDPKPTIAFGAALGALAWLVGWSRRLTLGHVVGAATMVGAVLLAMDAPDWTLGATTVLLGLLVAVGARWTQSSSAMAQALILATLGTLAILVSLGVEHVEAYALVLALALIITGEASKMAGWINWLPASTSSWATWTPALGMITWASIVGHLNGTSSTHLNFLLVCGAVSGMVGVLRRQAAPLLLGTVMTVGTAGYRVLDISVGVEGWGWLAISGATLLSVAGVLEYASIPPEEHPSRLTTAVRGSFR